MPLHAHADQAVDQAILERRAPSVGALFRNRVRATPDAAAYLYFENGGSRLLTMTWRETDTIVREWA
ncbi:MAG: long-chain fatty acid--CoA ligase, partial [Terracoccus sp.]